MEETLRAYRPLDSPAFRLVLNATHALVAEGQSPGRHHPREWVGPGPRRAHPLSGLRLFREAAGAILATVRPPRSTEYGAVVRSVSEDLAGRLAPAANSLGRAIRLLGRAPGAEGERILNAWSHLAGRGTEFLVQGQLSRRPLAERLLHVELAICLWDAWRRLIEAELLLAPSRSRR